ncbi:MAG: YceI family protein [Alphaproteobacteria bacterium]
MQQSYKKALYINAKAGFFKPVRCLLIGGLLAMSAFTISHAAKAASPMVAKAGQVAEVLEQVEPGLYQIDSTHVAALFFIKHLGFSNYTGSFNNITGQLAFDNKKPENSKLEVRIDASSIQVQSEELKNKLKGEDFFNVARYGEITFTSTHIQKISDSKGKVTGNLRLLGVEKPITLDVVFNAAGGNPFSGKKVLGFSATGKINRSDFGMKALLPAVGDEVSLRLEAEFVR